MTAKTSAIASKMQRMMSTGKFVFSLNYDKNNDTTTDLLQCKSRFLKKVIPIPELATIQSALQVIVMAGIPLL